MTYDEMKIGQALNEEVHSTRTIIMGKNLQRQAAIGHREYRVSKSCKSAAFNSFTALSLAMRYYNPNVQNIMITTSANMTNMVLCTLKFPRDVPHPKQPKSLSERAQVARFHIPRPTVRNTKNIHTTPLPHIAHHIITASILDSLPSSQAHILRLQFPNQSHALLVRLDLRSHPTLRPLVR